MEWYPTPSYLVKRRVILEYLERFSQRHFLEVGCGCGDLLQTLERKGYTGVGIDLSEEAVAFANSHLQGGRVMARYGTSEQLDGQFEIVIASEVLEHQQDDVCFLETLQERLMPGGLLLLTVPAHMAAWGANDDFCGHVRRYERDELRDKLVVAGYDGIEIYSYGVPVYNLMKPYYDRAIATKAPAGDLDERTSGSGAMWLMSGATLLFKVLFNDVTMYPWYVLQRRYYDTDRGMGYFAAARRRQT
jgi:SAM-dependent methyltransferase